MSESKMVTEREAVIRERRAFVAGSQFEEEAWQKMLAVNYTSGSDCIDASRKRYLLPKVERPRWLTEMPANVMWRFVDDVIECYWHGRWRGPTDTDGKWVPTPDRVRIWADLLANPTELVEDTP